MRTFDLLHHNILVSYIGLPTFKQTRFLLIFDLFDNIKMYFCAWLKSNCYNTDLICFLGRCFLQQMFIAVDTAEYAKFVCSVSDLLKLS